MVAKQDFFFVKLDFSTFLCFPGLNLGADENFFKLLYYEINVFLFHLYSTKRLGQFQVCFQERNVTQFPNTRKAEGLAGPFILQNTEQFFPIILSQKTTFCVYVRLYIIFFISDLLTAKIQKIQKYRHTEIFEFIYFCVCLLVFL